jgi:hypothetical protein
MDEIEYMDLNLHGTGMMDNALIDPLSLYLQELELALKILPGEVWGVTDSVNLKRYLFNRYVTMTYIRNEILGFIKVNCQHSTDFQTSVNVETLANPTGGDMVYIVMTVHVPGEGGTNFDVVQKFLVGANSL